MELISCVLLFKDEGSVLDCYCAGLTHAIQEVQETKSWFLHSDFHSRGVETHT